ncbi:MAG TPA: hypothetical protein VK066_04945 [Chloroflexota bacterium]|nr:hypothetical protein [Chloroflexota bacterium]
MWPNLRAERTVQTSTCECCGNSFQVVKGFVYRDGDTYAVYFAKCSPHEPGALVDVLLGTWGKNVNDDHVTFGRWAGPNPTEGQPSPVCNLTSAASTYGADALFGQKLERE